MSNLRLNRWQDFKERRYEAINKWFDAKVLKKSSEILLK